MYGTVERVEWLTPHLVRVLFGGERLDGLAVEEGLDRRVRQPAVRAAGGAVPGPPGGPHKLLTSACDGERHLVTL